MKNRILKTIEICREEQVLAPKLAELELLLDKINSESLIVSVLGQFKRGKTSLINTILGADILPVSIVPLTGTITEINKGDGFHAFVTFNDGRQQEIAPDELDEYISEQKNRNNCRNVKVVNILTDSFPFRENVTLVDTPGVGSLHRNNTDVSFEFVRKSDAVIFLLSVDSPISEIERDFLLRAKDSAAAFFFVVNKTDTINAHSLRDYLDYCEPMLCGIMDRPVHLFPISSKTGCGIDVLMENIAETLDGTGNAILAESVSTKFNVIKSQIISILQLKIKTAGITCEEFTKKTSSVRNRLAQVKSLSDEAQILTRRDADQLIERISAEFDDIYLNASEELTVFIRSLSEEHESLSSGEFESLLSERGENAARGLLESANREGLRILNEGYHAICSGLEGKSLCLAGELSNMLLEEFGVQYESEVQSFTVSDKSDFHYIFSKSSAYLFSTGDLIKLLPRKKAHEIILKKSVNGLCIALRNNMNNMLYNYRYKMQESLRTLCSEYECTTEKMNAEFLRLLEMMELNTSDAEMGYAERLGICNDLISRLESL